MKKITVLFLFWFVVSSCEEEARAFDFSKNIDFVFPVNQSDITAYDTTAILDFKDHSAINDYKKYAESYRVNGVSFSIEPLTDNTALRGTFRGTVLSDGSETEFFVLEDYEINATNLVTLNVSSSLIQQLTNDVNESGQITLRLTFTGDQQPGSLIFSLYFDTTVAAQLDF